MTFSGYNSCLRSWAFVSWPRKETDHIHQDYFILNCVIVSIYFVMPLCPWVRTMIECMVGTGHLKQQLQNCGASINEDYRHMHWSQQKVFISWQTTTLGIPAPSVALNIFQGELLTLKLLFWVGILQLRRAVSLKQNSRSQKATLLHLVAFPDPWTRMD